MGAADDAGRGRRASTHPHQERYPSCAEWRASRLAPWQALAIPLLRFGRLGGRRDTIDLPAERVMESIYVHHSYHISRGKRPARQAREWTRCMGLPLARDAY